MPGTDKRTCDMFGGCTALLGELHTQKAWSYTFIPTERVGSIHFKTQCRLRTERRSKGRFCGVTSQIKQQGRRWKQHKNHSKHRNRPTVERNKTSQTGETESHEVFPKQSK